MPKNMEMAFYEELEFVPLKLNSISSSLPRKSNNYGAFCTICEKTLTNTAKRRLEAHRRICKGETPDAISGPPFEIQLTEENDVDVDKNIANIEVTEGIKFDDDTILCNGAVPFRSWKQLRRKYEQVKKELRKRIAVSYRATQYKNEPGDGPFQKRDALKPLTPEEEDLFENLKSNAVGNPNLYGVETDHTTVFTAPFHSEVIGSYKNLSQYIREGEEEFEEDEPTVEVGEDEECVFVTDVRPTTSTRAKNKTEKRGLFKNLALKNKKLVQAELDLISLKRKHQEEIHQLEVKKLKLEIEILEKNL